MNSPLRLRARLLPHPLYLRPAPELAPPAVPAAQPAAPAPELDVLTGTPVLPPDNAKPSPAPIATIIPALILALTLSSASAVAPSTALPASATAHTSRPTLALTGNPLPECRDCSDHRGRLDLSCPQFPSMPGAKSPIGQLPPITPPLHHSITPPLHHSTTPSLHHSTPAKNRPRGRQGGGGGEPR